MARIAAVIELYPTDLPDLREARSDRGCSAWPSSDALMEQIIEDLRVTPPEEVLKMIASLPRTRQDKVLDIRRQLAEGTYAVADRLDGAMDRVLEAITA